MIEIVKKYRDLMDCPNCGEKRISYKKSENLFICRKCTWSFAEDHKSFLLQAKWHQGFDKGYWVALESVISNMENTEKLYKQILEISKKSFKGVEIKNGSKG